MKTEKSEYDTKADDFLKATETIISIEYLKYDYHFTDDTDKRDIYKITLIKGNRTFTFEYGHCKAHSGKFEVSTHEGITYVNEHKGLSTKNKLKAMYIRKNKEFKEPSAYDILACLTKDDPCDLKSFCDNYGYDPDSIKTNNLFNAVKNEWNNIKCLYSDSEIELLREIQ